MQKLFGAVLIPVLLAACGGGISTNTDFDPAADFSGYETYAWLPDGNGMDDGSGVHADQLTDGRIRSAVEANLNAKGMSKVSLDQADLAVGYQVAAQDRVQYNTVSTGWGGGYGGYYGGWGGMGMTSSQTYATNYTDGSLILGIFDTAEKQMIWKGVATKTLSENPDMEERTQNVNDAVAKLMADFPPSGN